MATTSFFPTKRTVGTFLCARQRDLEIHAELRVDPANHSRDHFLLGQFLLVQLHSKDEALLGRIAFVTPDSPVPARESEDTIGEFRALLDSLGPDSQTRSGKLLVRIRLLGVLRNTSEGNVFVSSVRAMPPEGSLVSFPSEETLREIIGHNPNDESIGRFALGNTVFAGDTAEQERSVDMNIVSPEIRVPYQPSSLISRRSFVFSRTGYGKSNLVKLLLSRLHGKKDTPKVGTILFDTDGEYFWSGNLGDLGLCDDPDLRKEVVVFTDQAAPNEYYQSFVAGGVSLDLRAMRHNDTLSIALGFDKQDQQNVNKLRALSRRDWATLVDKIQKEGYKTDTEFVRTLLKIDQLYKPESIAAWSNMNTIVARYHDPSSKTVLRLARALRDGKLCIVDVSQRSRRDAATITRLILRNIFEVAQKQFANKTAPTPVIAVLEEAHTLFPVREVEQSDVHVRWAKEGRKYNLGAIYVTQQPGGVPLEILSQGDNWFAFHLLAEEDLRTLKRANSHFSNDLLISLQNDAIPGNGIFWSARARVRFPISCRVDSYNEKIALDAEVPDERVETYVSTLIEMEQSKDRK